MMDIWTFLLGPIHMLCAERKQMPSHSQNFYTIITMQEVYKNKLATNEGFPLLNGQAVALSLFGSDFEDSFVVDDLTGDGCADIFYRFVVATMNKFSFY